jgi:hypothetical protein
MFNCPCFEGPFVTLKSQSAWIEGYLFLLLFFIFLCFSFTWLISYCSFQTKKVEDEVGPLQFLNQSRICGPPFDFGMRIQLFLRMIDDLDERYNIRLPNCVKDYL